MLWQKIALSLVTTAMLSACGTVRKQDLDLWVGVPVEALDTHTFVLTLPVSKTFTATGIEVRNYVNGGETENCTYNKYTGLNCSKDTIACNNIFFIKDGKVIEYAPTGHCMTDERVVPQARYRALGAK